MSLFLASTCFEHHVLIVRRSKIVLYSLWYHHTETTEWSKITKIYKYEHIVVKFMYLSNKFNNWINITSTCHNMFIVSNTQ